MEDNNSNVDNSAVLEQLQTLNKSVDSLTENQEELIEFLVKKDQETKEADTEKQEKEEQQKLETEKSSTEQAETYSETLQQISENINVTNHLISGQIFFMGVVVGVLLIKILFDRFGTRT